MKTAKLVIGIVTFVLVLLIMMQSCAAGLNNAMAENGEVGGTAGLMLAILGIVAGIIGIATRSSEGKGPFVAAGFYLVAAAIGAVFAGGYSDLYIRSALFAIFGLVFIFGTIKERKNK